MPANQQQYETMLMRLRQMGHILESTPGNIHRSFNNHRLQHGYLIEGNQEDPWYNDPQNPEASGASHSWETNAPSSSNNWAQPYQENSGIFVGEASTQQSLPNEYDSGTDTDTISSVGETYLICRARPKQGPSRIGTRTAFGPIKRQKERGVRPQASQRER